MLGLYSSATYIMTIPETQSPYSSPTYQPPQPVISDSQQHTFTLPHRAYRRIHPPVYFGLTALTGFVLCAIFLFFLIPFMNQGHVFLINQWSPHQAINDLQTNFGPWILQSTTFKVPFFSSQKILIGLSISAFILFMITQFQSIPLWSRYILGLFSGITLLNCLFLFFTPNQFISGDDFSLLYTKTQTLIWLALPLVAWLAAVSAMMPRWCWIFLPLLWLTIDFVFSIVRFLSWSVLLKYLGATISPLLYFFTGPILDALILVSMFSIMLYFTSRHLSKKEKKWSWL